MIILGDKFGFKNKNNLRVAAYCRISIEEEENREEGSYANQRAFFIKEIENHEGWIFAGAYGDYAKSGRQTDGRYGFQQLMKRAQDGQIDYILTKSIARFSRSASDTLEYLRKLTSLGVGVYFLEQSLDSLSGYGDVILTTLATIAEMESANLSTNVKMILRAMNQKGTPLQKSAYGYKRDEKEWVIVSVQAIRVKLAYLMAANGYSFTEIARRLNQFEQIDSTKRKWNSHMVKSLLLSEVYVGDILTNKTVVMNIEGKGRRCVPNNKIEDQYYIENHHEPMISRELWKIITQMIRDKQLAGQECFDGVNMVQAIANEDPLLFAVKKYIPRMPGRYIRLLEVRSAR